MFRRVLGLMAVLLMCASVQAQSGELPLILWIRGDLYSVDNAGAAPTPITHSGTVASPVMSPDGKTIAYRVAAQIGLEALNQIEASGKIADFDLPGEITLLDVASRGSVPLTTQPADASLLAEGVPDKVVIRSTPEWSPDGGRLAWTEFDYPGGQPRIVVYTMTTGQQTALAANLPVSLVQGAAPPLRWGEGWIAVNGSTDAAGEQDFLIYGEDGRLRSAPRLAAVPGDTALDFVPIRGQESGEGMGDLGVLYGSSGWILIDPATGIARAANTLPYIMTAAPDSLALDFGLDPQEGMFWEVVGGTAAAAAPPDKVTLSPSGQQIAFIGTPSSGAVSILSGNDSRVIPGTGSNLDELQVGAVLWGYTFWRIG